MPLQGCALGDGASMVDYGIARAKYLDTFVENIKWSEVSKRFGK
ncbi:Fe-Mn family superoxide dismutase [Geothrix limicola]|nr:Fe-Mn family superoxide dismutase [Geothrix limicola]